jgi:hypothetical protein
MQLLYPGFLWGLLAVSVPVAIHLLQLRRPQRVLFTNTGFIREVELTTMRRRRLQELLVLLARVLAVILLIVMFCQPFIPAQQNMVKGEADSAVEVLVDNSPSMRVQSDSQGDLLQSAIVGARTLGKSYGVNGRFQLLNQRGGASTEAAYDAQLANIAATTGSRASWAGSSVRRVLSGKSKQPLYIFSDFQKSEEGLTLLKKAPADKKIVLVPQTAHPTGNVYIDSVWVEDAFIRARTNVGLHIRLKNGGSEVVSDCPVKVLLGEKQVAAFRTTLGRGQTSTTLVQLQLPDTKLALGRVVTEDTPITSDNTFYFTLQPTNAIRVLEIGTEPVAQQAYSNEPLFVYSFVRPQEVNYSQLRRANLVLLDELMQIDAGLRQALVEVVRQGGSVVMVPTGKVAARESYHQLFRALGVGGEQWTTQANGQPVLQSVAMPSRQNPFFKDVFGMQSRQVLMPQAAPVLNWGRNGTDVLRLQDGDSYLTQFESGNGKFYVFASPFTKAYSDFTANALFVPVLYRLAMLSYHSDQRIAYRLTTPTVAVPLPVAQATQTSKEDAGFRLVQDSAVFVPTQRVQGQELRFDVPADMTKPGFYEVRQQNKPIVTLAFNTDRRESELAAYSAAELRELIGANRPNIHVLENGAKPEVLTRYRAEQTGQPLWRYCLVLALSCLLAEALLLRFGRTKAFGRQPAVVG